MRTQGRDRLELGRRGLVLALLLRRAGNRLCNFGVATARKYVEERVPRRACWSKGTGRSHARARRRRTG